MKITMNITNFITLLLQIDLPIFKHNKKVVKDLFILLLISYQSQSFSY